MSDEERLKALETLAEQAYDRMYEARSPASAGGLFAEAKEYLTAAIDLAERMERPDQARRLRQRLEHITAVYRSQMSS